MNFKEFCEETDKIILLHEEEKNSWSFDLIHSSPNVRVYQNIHGLYFPNEKELGKIYEETEGEYFYSTYKKTLPIMESYFSTAFMKRLNNKLNVNFEHYPFEELEEFLKEKKYDESLERQRLADIVGRAYEKTGLLDSDIRIVALKTRPEIKIISLEKIQVGYAGLGFSIAEEKTNI
jgi:hypothetical protein